MTEPSPVNADQACQANQDCNYSIAGQICLDNKCTFYCTIDSDCISNGKCISEKCDWSGEPVPPLFLNSTLSNLDTTNSSEKTTANKLTESSRGLKPLQLSGSRTSLRKIEISVGYPTLGQQHHFMQQERWETHLIDNEGI
ncbi:8896_t:CDS:2 [Rhizophagus irregularis]|nr:8896_t:CDS:2 [Rhizophagus irregularis]